VSAELVDAAVGGNACADAGLCVLHVFRRGADRLIASRCSRVRIMMRTRRYHGVVRTTVTLDSDVAAEIERLRHAGMGLSQALNMLARRGIAKDSSAAVKYQHRTSKIGLKVDVTNIADVLSLIDDDRQ
jgi:hypothetical protein